MGLLSGAVIAQRYELEQLLGEGGMGSVWSARHLLTHKRVAIKFLKEPAQPELVRRFVREARAASAVRHPNVIGIHDVVMLDDGLPAMVMDLLEGESLGTRLARDGRIAVHALASIMVPVLSAVGAAHALGIVHRDLKPDNIFLARRDEDRIEPVVLDFGICKLSSSDAMPIEASTLTVTGSLMGTPYYMAPEQVFGERDVDARVDVWALGIILYECTTGTRPVEGENVGQLLKRILSGAIRPIQEVAPHLPPEFANVVNRMLIQDRAKRTPDLREPFETLRAMTDVGAQSFGAAATVRLASGQPVSDASPSTPDSALSTSAVDSPVTSSVGQRARKRSVPLILASAAAGLALVVVAGIRLVSGSGAPVAETSRHTSPALPATPVVAAVPSAVAAVGTAAAAPSSSAVQSTAASASAIQAKPRHAPKSGAERKAHDTLAGGVHGAVPF
jgi:serine/threonine protein kinase